MKPLHMLDAAMRDIDSVRVHARHRELAAVGACMDGSCDAAKSRPVCDSYNINDLDKNYQQIVVVARALAGQQVTTVTFNMLDQYACPLAISGIARDSSDGQTQRPFMLIQARIRGCVQQPYETPETVQTATAFIDSAELDPTGRSGCACPVNWGCFTNQATGSANLQVVLGNPAPSAIPITVKLTLWAVTYSCCPGFTTMRDFHKPWEPEPAQNPQPLGNARQGAFARR